MAPTKKPPIWPSDDQVREQDGNDALTDDGRKLQEAEHVGANAPDADPERPPPKRRVKQPSS
jgi:hypothetical protein